MRIIYFILKFVLNYSLRVFYPRTALHNSPKEFFGRTIYVSNHAASFMDPLVVATLRMPIVFFMTRSDVFVKALQPILWASQMLPIYRQLDGEDTKGKNEEVFKKCTKILSSGRNLLIFGEGFTDDVFIRRLKPVKKGAVRIGFLTLENMNWKKKVYIAAVGCNYSDPNLMRSDLVISTSDKICLNDYREEYEANPNKVMNHLSQTVERLMQEQITHVKKVEHAPFHEHIMMITRKGMNSMNFDRSIPLKKRWRYSQQLANWMNEQNFEENEKLSKLQKQAESYFGLLKRFKLEEHLLFWKKENPAGSRAKELFMLTLLFPFAIIGAIHCAIPYIITKRFVEGKMKRRVFWSSVKLTLGQLLIALFNIPTFFLFYHFVYPSWWLAFGYFLTIGLTGLAAYMWVRHLKTFIAKGKINKTDVSALLEKRAALETEINSIVPEFEVV